MSKIDSDWVVAESLPAEKCDMAELRRRWMEVADDMALIPENNVEVVEDKGVVRVLVSRELYDCMRGA